MRSWLSLFLSLFAFLCVFSVSLCLCGSISLAAWAQRPPKQAEKKPPQVERITDRLYRVGKAMVDTEARTVTCRGVVNMSEGPIEYLAVAPGGKTHESLLRVDVRPLHLQVALLLLGLEPKNVLKRQGEKTTPQGDPVELRVRWRNAAGEMQEVRAEEWVMEMPGKKPMPSTHWVFTGSRIWKEGFAADLDKSLVAVWHDPAAILDNPLPGGANNAYVVHPQRVPRRGTPIEFILKAVNPLPAGSGEKKPDGAGAKSK